VVKALRCQSEGRGIDPQWCRWRFIPKLPTEPCALESTQPLKMSTRKLLGVKAAGCVGVTTLPPSQCRKSRKAGALTYRIPKGLLRPVAGKLYFYLVQGNVRIRPLYDVCVIVFKWSLPSAFWIWRFEVLWLEGGSSAKRLWSMGRRITVFCTTD
jgi:hypothetical protein